MNIVVLSPHRDDAAFSLSLSIGTWLNQSHTVTIVNCFTRSEYAPYSDAESIHPNDRRSYVTALRLREDEAWIRHFPKGLTHLDLNLKDAPLRLRCAFDQVCTTPVNPQDKALLKIRKSLEDLAPHALLLPLALGSHVDHLTARDAALPLAHSIPSSLYEDLPYASRPGTAEQIEALAQSLHLPLTPVFTRQANDPDAAEQCKYKLALTYDSQINNEVAADIARFSRHYNGRERLWATPAWLGLSLTAAEEVRA